jgi:hypothetical protein
LHKLSQNIKSRVQFFLKGGSEMIKVALGACMVELGRHNRLKICRPKGVPVRVRLQAPFYSDDLTFLAENKPFRFH